MSQTTESCPWCLGDDLYQRYHDEEWGVPLLDDTKLFEFLTLEGAQAGLSWITVLKKRDRYRERFSGFDIETVAALKQKDVESLLQDAGLIRNRLKLESTVTNAQAALRMQEQHGSLRHYLWQFVDHQPITNRFTSLKQVPANTPVSDAMSKRLKKDGFRFVGTTICYAFMQATGMVNDHLTHCPRHAQLASM